MKEKLVWYMVYRLRNTGVSVTHNAVEDPKFGHVDQELVENTGNLDPNPLSNRFIGRFYLEGWVNDSKTGMYSKVAGEAPVPLTVAVPLEAPVETDQLSASPSASVASTLGATKAIGEESSSILTRRGPVCVMTGGLFPALLISFQ